MKLSACVIAVCVCACVVTAINRYAVCESNKARLVRRNLLGHYTQLMGRGCSEEEHMVAAKGVWSLAFNDENRSRMRQDTPCLEGRVSSFAVVSSISLSTPCDVCTSQWCTQRY